MVPERGSGRVVCGGPHRQRGPVALAIASRHRHPLVERHDMHEGSDVPQHGAGTNAGDGDGGIRATVRCNEACGDVPRVGVEQLRCIAATVRDVYVAPVTEPDAAPGVRGQGALTPTIHASDRGVG